LFLDVNHAVRLDQLVVGTLLEAENNLRPVRQDRSPDEPRFVDHHFDQLIVGGLPTKISIRLRTRASPREHFVDTRHLAQLLDLFSRQLLFEEISEFVLATRIIESPTGFLARTST